MVFVAFKLSGDCPLRRVRGDMPCDGARRMNHRWQSEHHQAITLPTWPKHEIVCAQILRCCKCKKLFVGSTQAAGEIVNCRV
jgi:hypothetical protein